MLNDVVQSAFQRRHALMFTSNAAGRISSAAPPAPSKDPRWPNGEESGEGRYGLQRSDHLARVTARHRDLVRARASAGIDSGGRDQLLGLSRTFSVDDDRARARRPASAQVRAVRRRRCADECSALTEPDPRARVGPPTICRAAIGTVCTERQPGDRADRGAPAWSMVTLRRPLVASAGGSRAGRLPAVVPATRTSPAQ